MFSAGVLPIRYSPFAAVLPFAVHIRYSPLATRCRFRLGRSLALPLFAPPTEVGGYETKPAKAG